MLHKATVVCLLLAAVASAGQEQWLRYCTSPEPSELIGGTYGQSHRARPRPPNGLELPKLTSDEPLFCWWESPCAKDGRAWLALDRTGKSGPHDRLYIDSDLDGSLADEEPLRAARKQQQGDYLSATFELAKIVLPGDDGPVAYHLNVRYRQYRGRKDVYFRPAGWYEGAVTVGGKKLWCTLIDNSGNGRFNDSAPDRKGCDRIRLAPKGDRSFREYGTDRTTRFVGRYVEVGDKLYSLEISPDGACVKFAPAGGVRTGTVQVGKTVNAFSVFGPQGHFFRQAKGGAADVPAGKYLIGRYEVNRTDESGARWQVKEGGAAYEKPFTVEPGRKTTLDIGEPFVCKVNLSRRGRNHVIGQSIKSRKGDNLSLTRNGSRPPAPRVRIVNADGSYKRTYRMEYG